MFRHSILFTVFGSNLVRAAPDKRLIVRATSIRHGFRIVAPFRLVSRKPVVDALKELLALLLEKCFERWQDTGINAQVDSAPLKQRGLP
jgi:hypothetical protein